MTMSATTPDKVFEHIEVAQESLQARTPNTHVQLHPLEDEAVGPEYSEMLRRGQGVVLPNHVEMMAASRKISAMHDKVFREERSAHGVGFGVVESRHGDALEVATKPFTRYEDALSEVRGALILKGLGVETYEPVGVFPSARPGHYVTVTVARHDLVSLDRAKWVSRSHIGDTHDEDEARRHMEIAEQNHKTVSAVASLLGRVHARGVFHPDGQIKNFAITPEGHVGIIDTEGLRQVALGDPNAAGMAWHDITKLTRSLVGQHATGGGDAKGEKVFGVGMLSGLGFQPLRDAIELMIFEPYIEALRQARETASDVEAAHIDQLVDGAFDNFYHPDSHGRETWPDHSIVPRPNN